MKEVIHCYSRSEAIADGLLLDVSTIAIEAGFRYPVAVTHSLWAEHIAISDEDAGQDEEGRLWDILTMLRHSIRSSGDESMILFDVLIAKGGQHAKPFAVKSHCGPGDNLEPVITLMLPNED